MSRFPLVNDICVWAMSFLCNPILWQHQHTYGHHSHTNDFEKDPDLHHFHFLLRVHRNIQVQEKYKNQKNWLYVMFAYTFVVFGTCFWIPWGTMLDGSLYGIVEWTDRHRPLRALGMAMHLLFYVWIVAILPMYHHTSCITSVIATILHVSISGLVFALFSQINHLNEPSITCIEEKDELHKNSIINNPVPVSESSSSKAITTTNTTTNLSVHSMIKNSWAAAQIESSNNFAPDSKLWYILSNGLNLQIEHHLFPGINHCHLHHVTKVVRETCEEYGVTYKCYQKWDDLMAATLTWLDKLSVAEGLTKVVVDGEKKKLQ